jgi:hypothetical protein
VQGDGANATGNQNGNHNENDLATSFGDSESSASHLTSSERDRESANTAMSVESTHGSNTNSNGSTNSNSHSGHGKVVIPDSLAFRPDRTSAESRRGEEKLSASDSASQLRGTSSSQDVRVGQPVYHDFSIPDSDGVILYRDAEKTTVKACSLAKLIEKMTIAAPLVGT